MQTSLKEAIGPIASQAGSVPVFLKKYIATCDFPGGGGGGGGGSGPPVLPSGLADAQCIYVVM